MNWLFWVLLIICVLNVIRGARKGFVRMLVSTVFLVLVFVISSVINPYVSDFIKEHTGVYRMFTERCSDSIEKQLEETGGELTLNMQVQLIDELPFPRMVKDGLLKNNTPDSYRKLAVTKFADYIATYMGNLLVKAVAFLVSFILALLVIQIFLYMTDILTALPVIHQLNYAGGACLGFVWAMLWIGLIFIFAAVFSDSGVGQMIQAATAESAVVRWFYDHNIFWILIEVFLGL